jgi:hypothetical protein
MWLDKIASSLWRLGAKDDCLDAAKDAFLKVMGLHPKYKLSEPLEPRALGQWYKMLYHQARGILSNRRKHDERAAGFSTSDEDEVGAFGTQDYDHDMVCRDDLRRTIRAVVLKVVAAVNGIKSTNALYVRNKSVLDRLMEVGQDKSSELYRLWAA